ncbi:MAG: amidohydrolase [Candidatus Nanohalarchaeota archaeon]|nr:MAG: amidohydrolase [Candidatus Nanohaloarchaeota archaeon]
MIIEGHFVNYDNSFFGQVKLNEQGIIEKIGYDLGEPNLKYNDDILIFPGFIDVHVHCREDESRKQNYKEDYRTASEAAINGGVVYICDMPNNPTAPITKESYLTKKELTKKAKIPVTLYAGIGPDTSPIDLTVPYKVFMGPSVGDLFFSTNEELEKVISRYAGKNISFHCEDPVILEQNKDQPTHGEKRPPEAEIKAIEFALELIEKYNLSGKICHVSTKKGMERIIDAKKRGVNVLCEATPHHLFFSEDDLNESNRKFLQMNPPIRKKEDCDFLIESIKEGYVDFIATDHAPHTLEEKQNGMSGVSHIDAYSAFALWLIKEKEVSPATISRICSYSGGLFVNQYNDLKFGKIAEGYAGAFTIIDPNKKFTFSKENVKSKCGWSCFEGIEFEGNVVNTILAENKK